MQAAGSAAVRCVCTADCIGDNTATAVAGVTAHPAIAAATTATATTTATIVMTATAATTATATEGLVAAYSLDGTLWSERGNSKFKHG